MLHALQFNGSCLCIFAPLPVYSPSLVIQFLTNMPIKTFRPPTLLGDQPILSHQPHRPHKINSLSAQYLRISQSPLMSLPVEIRAKILKEAIVGVSNWPDTDYMDLDPLMRTCKAISDELFPILFPTNGIIHSISFNIHCNRYAPTSWLIARTCTSVRESYPSVWPSSKHCKFLVRDLDDQKLKTLIHRARVVENFNVFIDIPQLAAKGRSKSEDLAVIWSKVRDIATLIAQFRSVRSVNCYFSKGRPTKLDYHRFFHCPVKVNQETSRSSLHSLIIGALADPFIKNGPFSEQRLPTAQVLNISCIDVLLNPWFSPWLEDYEHQLHPESFCHDAARISKTLKEGLCMPQSLPK